MDVSVLLPGLSDPEKAVRIASLRALVRVPLDPDIEQLLRPHRVEYERHEIYWATWTPDTAMCSRIAGVVDVPEAAEKALAQRIVFRSPSEITKDFARLALHDYGPVSENLLVDAHVVASRAASMGEQFVPDIPGLFQVYLVFLRRAADFWFPYVLTLSEKGNLRPAAAMPSSFPLYEGALAATRQIEWVASRAGLERLLAELKGPLEKAGSRERFAAAQLVEWASRNRFKKSPWDFGGDSGPEDTIYDSAVVPEDYKASYETFTGNLPVALWRSKPDIPQAPPPGPPPPPHVAPPEPLPLPEPPERRISFWVAEAENAEQPLELNHPYTGNFRVGKPVASSLIRSEDSAVPDSDVPPGGLLTAWTVIPHEVKLEAFDKKVAVSESGLATFSLLIPESGDSDTIKIRVTALASQAKMFVLVHVSGKLYRELEISLQTGKIISDQPLTRLDETDLEPSHEWTEPPGLLTFYISRPGYATIFGSTRTEVFPPGLEVDFGTDKSDLSGSVDRLRNAAEDFRKVPAWTAYLNDIDPTNLRDKLSEFRPQYDWSRLADFTDDPHRTAWEKAAASDELRTLAFYGRSLYDTLFANDGTSRSLIEKLPPGQFIHIVWRQDSGAPWVPHLPWALLYMGDVDNNSRVDATLFWGLRFRLQHTAYKSTATASNSLGGPREAYCTNLLFFGQSKNEPATAEAEWQRNMWSLLSDVSRSWIVPDEKTTAAKAELLRVLNAPEAAVAIAGAHVAVLYLFCHYGKDASGNSLLRFGLDASNPDDILREPELGTSAIASHPLVFANACATAGADVYTANAITKSFFTRGARAFIGTDCMVPPTMASRFAMVFFHFLLRVPDKEKRPMKAGEAMAQARLFFWCHYRNIGGLLYSYLNQYDLYMADQAEINGLKRKR